MKKLLLFVMSFLLLFTASCAWATPQDSVRVVSPPGSPTPAPTPSIVIPVGPAKTYTFGLPWTRVARVRPLSDSLRYNDQWSRLCYESLFELDETLTAKPLLCANCVTEDNRVYVLTLRADVSFHNGETLGADDVVYSFNEAMKKDSPYSTRFETVASVKRLDELTVEVTLTKPMARFTALLDFPIVWGGSPQPDIAPGTGPYSVHIDGEEGTYLLESGGWWQNKTLPLSRIELVAIENQDDLAYYFQNGTISLVTVDPYDLIAPQVHSGMEVWRMPTADMIYIGFNTSQKPLDDPQTRKAISMALDREAITKAAYGSYAVPSALPAPPSSAQAGVTVDIPGFDFGASSLLLEELGYSDEDYDEVLEYQASRYVRRPFEIDILVNSENLPRVDIARMCAEQLSQLGIKANVRSVKWESYAASLNAGTYGLYIGGVKLSADLPVGRFVSKDGDLNFSGYSDNELDGLLEDLASAPSYAQKAAAGKVYRHLLDNVPFMTLCFRETAVGTQRGLIQSLTPLGWNEFYGFPEWKINE